MLKEKITLHENNNEFHVLLPKISSNTKAVIISIPQVHSSDANKHEYLWKSICLDEKHAVAYKLDVRSMQTVVYLVTMF